MANSTTRVLALLSAGSAMLALAMPAAAAAAAPAAAPEASAESDAAPVITVTARKRGENLINVPVAITALSGDQLTERGVKGFNELNDYVPGLRYENSAANRNDRSFHTITMRGMYPGDSPNRQAATVFVDGIAIPNASIPGLSDIERVEVVKGPQSAYFGRATFAGAVSFVTRAPSLTSFRAHAEASYASYGETDDSVSVEGPLIRDKLAVRVSGRYYHTDGQYDNFGYSGKLGERDTKSFAASFIAKPVEDLKIRGYFTMWQDKDGPSAQAVLTEQDYNCNAGGTGVRVIGGLSYICGGIGSAPTYRMSQNNTTNIPALMTGGAVLPDDFIGSLGFRRKEYQANVSADYDFNGFVASALYGQNRNRWAALTDTYNRAPDGTGYYSSVYLPYDIHNKSAEVRLASPTGSRLKAMIGGNYYDEDISFQVKALRPTAGVATITNLSLPTHYKARTYGIFGSLSYDITDALTISGEGRYQWDKIHHIVTPVGATTPSVDLQQTFKSFSPRVIVSYKVAPSASVYASWARGTRPGTFNSNFVSFTAFQQAQINANAPGGSVPLAVPEEKLNSYEVGVKGDFFDRKLLLLLDGYYGLWRHRQINQNIPYFATPTATTTSTATLTFPNGSTDLWGIELEATYRVTHALSFDGTFNWAHTKVLYTQCSECVNVNNVVNPVGNEMERYPQFSGTIGVNYNTAISGKWRFNGRADMVYTGKQYATEANVAYLKAGERVNATIGVDNGAYKIELFVRNLNDSKVPSNILRNANPNSLATQGSNLIVLAAPDRRTFGIRGSLTFK